VLNAVNDALAQVGAVVERIPVRPADVVAAIAAARGAARRGAAGRGAAGRGGAGGRKENG